MFVFGEDRYVIFTNRHFREEAHPRDMVWFMEPLLKMVLPKPISSSSVWVSPSYEVLFGEGHVDVVGLLDGVNLAPREQ